MDKYTFGAIVCVCIAAMYGMYVTITHGDGVAFAAAMTCIGAVAAGIGGYVKGYYTTPDTGGK